MVMQQYPGLKPLILGLAAIYLVFAIALAHTAFVAVHRLRQPATCDTSQVVQRLQQALAEAVAQPLQNTSTAVTSLLHHAAKIEQYSAQLHSELGMLKAGTAAGPPPAAHGALVKDEELHHIATHTSICDKQGAAGLSLNVTDVLVAPVIIVGHNRPGYMAKAIMSIMRWVTNP